ncbi:hypothetical protein CONPUDRAFT_156683 [Coniophora puteana RWD-64-598 SS2]|uniref:Uncharacterized protein n=1 Tax=Coniophora puteana (strain RWD-64-598) TaxID=741705 RepID=A0A5M3MI99_CONPW|nr:uncharacterized protein CONPUDRAFT_156683 [Coniophora puteana RWD-64-598 SS2]EIW78726.1 hypothetical protein CONPUDRAFT_156683 [Coniophora puteana RWD-64-598 SS2]
MDVVWKDTTTHTTGLLNDTGFLHMQALMTTARTCKTNFHSTSTRENNHLWLQRAICCLQDILDRFCCFPSSLHSIILDVTDFQHRVMDIWALMEWWLCMKNRFYSHNWTKVKGLKKEDGIRPDSSNSISLVNINHPCIIIKGYHENSVDMHYGHSHEDPESFKIHGISANDLGLGLQNLLKQGALSVWFLNYEAGPSTRPSCPKPSKSKRSIPYTHPSTGPKREQCDKRTNLIHKFWPDRFDAWRVALKEVDKSFSCVCNVAMNSGYFFPEPALFCGVTNFSCLACYVKNWLANCKPWINYVRTSPPELPPKGQNWQNSLNGAIWVCTLDNNGSGSERNKACMLWFLHPILHIAQENCEVPSIVVCGTAITCEQM